MTSDRQEKKLNVRDIADLINGIAPVGLQEEWDNSGLIIGFEKMHVKKILTCLEASPEVVDEAKASGADMIVTHHPLIFGGIKNICDGDHTGNMVMSILESGISVYSCHTPFDKVKGGNNDALAELIGLTSIKTLDGRDVAAAAKMMENENSYDIARRGKFKKAKDFKEIIDLVCDRLQLSLRDIRAAGNMDDEIDTVGLCTGAGSEFIEAAADNGCQLFITGDVTYHEAQKARERGICLLDAGHYGTEKLFSETMKEKLDKKLEGAVEVIASSVDLNPFMPL